MDSIQERPKCKVPASSVIRKRITDVVKILDDAARRQYQSAIDKLCRFYTQKDFLERLLPLIKDCSLVDVPQWDCPNPDFVYAGCRYTFATLVFRKDKQ
jgi:hypothetical protein